MKCENDISDVTHRQFVDELKACSDAVGWLYYLSYKLCYYICDILAHLCVPHANVSVTENSDVDSAQDT